MSLILTPRFHLLEIGDQSWCPTWLREYSHLARMQMWKTQATATRGSPATLVVDLLLRYLPDASATTFVDACAGGGGPIPILERVLNARLLQRGVAPADFLLTDLWPSLPRWRAMAQGNPHIDYVAEGVDATRAPRLAPADRKECRVFNLCFHHFDDDAARRVLRSAVESADAFAIFEMTNRTLTSFLNTTFIVLSPFFTTLAWFADSPLHLVFTYLIPLVPLMFAVDGYVSCIRGRTNAELTSLMTQQKDLDLRGWRFECGETRVLPPFGVMYWYIGVKDAEEGKEGKGGERDGDGDGDGDGDVVVQ